MIYITDDSEVKLGAGISAIYFYAPWLNFHKKMQIMIEKVENKHKNLHFYAVDVDSFKNLCNRFSIKSIPTVIIFKDNGEEIKRINGVTLTSAFRKIFADIYDLYEEEHGK